MKKIMWTKLIIVTLPYHYTNCEVWALLTVGSLDDSVCDVLMVLDNRSQLNVQTKPVEPLVEGGAQIQQVLNIECLTDFSDAPLLNIKFR